MRVEFIIELTKGDLIIVLDLPVRPHKGDYVSGETLKYFGGELCEEEEHYLTVNSFKVKSVEWCNVGTLPYLTVNLYAI